MWKQNDGIGESSILQNEFTAYLGTAIRRRKIQYLQSKAKLRYYEVLLESQDCNSDFDEMDMMSGLPFIEQLENVRLQQVLTKINQRNLYILFAKILEHRSLAEIAIELGLKCNTVTAAYYRVIHRLKKELGGDDK